MEINSPILDDLNFNFFIVVKLWQASSGNHLHKYTQMAHSNRQLATSIPDLLPTQLLLWEVV